MAVTASGYTVEVPNTDHTTPLQGIPVTQKEIDLITIIQDDEAFVNPGEAKHASLTTEISAAITAISALKVFEVTASSVSFTPREILVGGTSGATGLYSSFVSATNMVQMVDPTDGVTGGAVSAGGSGYTSAPTCLLYTSDAADE